MKPSQIGDVLDLARRAKSKGKVLNPVFVSAPGLGKTEIIQQWCKSQNLPFIVFTSALYEAPDVKGFPIVKIDPVTGRQQQTTAIPDYWPSDGEGVVILEEINRGTTSIMNCLMSLTDQRRGFDGYKLPEGWIVCGAINHESELYDVNAMDPALKDRLEFFEVNYDKKEFIQFMNENDWHQDVRMFVESNTWSYVKPEDIGEAGGTKYIAPRTLSKLNAALLAGIPKDNSGFDLTIYESILGKNVGSTFFQFRNDEQPVLFKDIVKNPDKAFLKLKKFSDPQNYKAGHVSLTVKDLVENSADLKDDLLVKVIFNIPADEGPNLISQLEYKAKKADSKVVSGEFLDRIVKNYPEVKKYFRDVLNK